LNDPHPEVVEAAAESYAYQSSAFDPVVMELVNRDQEITNHAAGRGLMRRATLHALELLEPTLLQKYPRVEPFELAGMASQIGPQAAPILRHLLDSESDAVRSAARSGLAAIEKIPP
jgi:HEAT repeat protein